MFSRVKETRKSEVIAREGQPRVDVDRPEVIGGPVASSWISSLYYDLENEVATMNTFDLGEKGIDYRSYDFPEFPPAEFDDWWLAMSKGTFYHERVKNLGYLKRRMLLKRVLAKVKARKYRRRENRKFKYYSDAFKEGLPVKQKGTGKRAIPYSKRKLKQKGLFE